MRFTPFILPGLLLLAGFFMPIARAQTSFGPEISAEDFGQHVLNLQAIKALRSANAIAADTRQLTYLTQQFTRLGIAHKPLTCPSGNGFQAVLPGTQSGSVPVVYKAQWHDAHEMAGVLEVAEHFMTQRPRPVHAVAFIFTDNTAKPDSCSIGLATARQFTPEKLAELPATALVQYLNRLHTQGK